MTLPTKPPVPLPPPSDVERVYITKGSWDWPGWAKRLFGKSA